MKTWCILNQHQNLIQTVGSQVEVGVHEGKRCQQDLMEEACVGLLCLGELECPKYVITEDLFLESKSPQNP